MSDVKEKTKIIAMYLPQFHEIPENNLFWGDGFTDWISVRQAEQLFEGHIQPKEPLNDNYYDLSSAEVLKWQAGLAREYGVYGFCFYHYWFENNKPVLERPAQNLLIHSEIDLPFCFAWDNTSWVRTWSKFNGNAWAPKYETKDMQGKLGQEYLLKLDYGTEKEWIEHFNFLLPYFKDERYIKKEGKPVFIFFASNEPECMVKMAECWRNLARLNGFPGLHLISGRSTFIRKKILDAEFTYQPIMSGWQKAKVIRRELERILRVKLPEKRPGLYDYDRVWRRIIWDAYIHQKENLYLGGFVNYDDTPRRGRDGKVIINSTCAKFERYLKKLYRICQNNHKEYLFLTAWNEWGEGAYLEPDKRNRCGYLEAIKKVVNGE